MSMTPAQRSRKMTAAVRRIEEALTLLDAVSSDYEEQIGKTQPEWQAWEATNRTMASLDSARDWARAVTA